MSRSPAGEETFRVVEVRDDRLTNRIREVRLPLEADDPVEDLVSEEQVERIRAHVAALVAASDSVEGERKP